MRAQEIQATLLAPHLNHALEMVRSGYASRQDVDAAMQLGCGYQKGPVALAEAFGLNTLDALLAARFATTADHRHRPSPWLTAGLAPQPSEPTTEAVPASAPTLRVAVLGTGTMGAGIAYAFAAAGAHVVAIGRSTQSTDKVTDFVRRTNERLVARARLDQPRAQQIASRITTSTTLEDAARADLVLEAVAEEFDIKADLFAKVAALTGAGTILATTTSSMPVTRLAVASGAPERFICLHFFNPAATMKLVEVVSTVHTSAATIQTSLEIVARIGKVAVACGDRPGFVVNALLFPYLNDAVRLHDETGTPVEEIDAAMIAAGLPVGPFALLDIVGLDVSLAITRQLDAAFGDTQPSLTPAPSLVSLVKDGHLGRKTGRGFSVGR